MSTRRISPEEQVAMRHDLLARLETELMKPGSARLYNLLWGILTLWEESREK